MNKAQKQVRNFHIKMNLEWNDTPDMLDAQAKLRRTNLIYEELEELEEEKHNKQLEKLAALR